MIGEFESVHEVLMGSEGDWKKREEGLRRLAGRLRERKVGAFEYLNGVGAKAVAANLADLRSSLVKEALEVVLSACKIASSSKGFSIEKFTENFLKDPNLLKAVGSANKVIRGQATSAMMAVFEAGNVSMASIEGLSAAFRGSKSPNVRETLAICIEFAADAAGRGRWPLPLSQWRSPRARNDFADFLRRTAETFSRDATPGVRAAGKKIRAVVDAGLPEAPDSRVSVGAVDESRETADEISPSQTSVAPPKRLSLRAALEDETLPPRMRLEALARARGPQISELDDFVALLGAAESAKSTELRREITRLIAEVPLGPLGSRALLELARRGRTSLRGLEERAISAFSLEAFGRLVADVGGSVLPLFREKLQVSRPDELFAPARRPLLSAIITQAANVAASPEAPQVQRIAGAEILASLAGDKLFWEVAPDERSLLAAARFAREKGIPGAERLQSAPALAELDLAPRLKTASPVARLKVLEGLLAGLGSLPAENGPDFQRALARSADAVAAIAETSPLDEQTLRTTCAALEAIASRSPNPETLKRVFLSLLQLFRANSRELRGHVAASAVSVGAPEALMRLLFETLANKLAPVSGLTDSLKFLICFLKAGAEGPDPETLRSLLRPLNPTLVTYIRTGLFSHHEVVIRKTVVQLLVQMYHFWGDEEFEKHIVQFTPEQQKLVQVYLRKSLE